MEIVNYNVKSNCEFIIKIDITNKIARVDSLPCYCCEYLYKVTLDKCIKFLLVEFMFGVLFVLCFIKSHLAQPTFEQFLQFLPLSWRKEIWIAVCE